MFIIFEIYLSEGGSVGQRKKKVLSQELFQLEKHLIHQADDSTQASVWALFLLSLTFTKHSLLLIVKSLSSAHEKPSVPNHSLSVSFLVHASSAYSCVC